jgi:hypothetical protein
MIGNCGEEDFTDTDRRGLGRGYFEQSSSLGAEQVVQGHILDFPDSSQGLIVPITSQSLMPQRVRDLNRIRRGKTITGSQFSRAGGHIKTDGHPPQILVRGVERENLLCQILLLLAIWLDQKFEQCHRGSHRPSSPPLETIEKRGAPCSVARMILKEVNEEVGVGADSLVLGWQSAQRRTRPAGSLVFGGAQMNTDAPRLNDPQPADRRLFRHCENDLFDQRLHPCQGGVWMTQYDETRGMLRRKIQELGEVQIYCDQTSPLLPAD